jgi:SAM-dependent methyltransferase
MMDIRRAIPESLKKLLRPVYYAVRKPDKYKKSLDFWHSRLRIDSGTFVNSHYQRLMLGMAGEDSDRFLAGRVVADFGCGPRGSLVWAGSAGLRIGIDVLADQYIDHFKSNLVNHGMIYLTSTETAIPLPSDYVDVMYTLNAIDHVDDFGLMCDEIVRTIKPGGEFIGSFNINEPPSVCEPQSLTEEIVKGQMLGRLEIQSYRLANRGPEGDMYAGFFDAGCQYDAAQPGFLWVRGKKKP